MRALVNTHFVDRHSCLHLILLMKTAGRITQQQCLSLNRILTLIACCSLRYWTAIELLCTRFHCKFVVSRVLILTILLLVIEIQILLISLVIIRANNNPSSAHRAIVIGLLLLVLIQHFNLILF